MSRDLFFETEYHSCATCTDLIQKSPDSSTWKHIAPYQDDHDAVPRSGLSTFKLPKIKRSWGERLLDLAKHCWPEILCASVIAFAGAFYVVFWVTTVGY